MAGTTDDTSITLPTNEPTSEQSGMTDVAMQLVDIESVNQTIRKELLKSEKNGDETTALVLKSLLLQVAGLQSGQRKSPDTHARPENRKLHIFILPDELLIKICENVRGKVQNIRKQYAGANFQDIKSLRLVCRRFCGASSHLLVPQLPVSLTESSLNRLDEVSRHPTISKGVRKVHICAALHRPWHTATLPDFVRQILWRVRDDYLQDLNCVMTALEGADLEFSPESSPELDYNILSEHVDKSRTRNEILLSCINYLRTETFSPSDDQTMTAICRAHTRHSQVLEEQELLLESDVFAKRVALATERMPTIVEMHITDHFGSDILPKRDCISSRHYVYIQQELLMPSYWTPESTSPLPQHPIKLLYQLPIAITRAGNTLTKLRISISSGPEKTLRLAEHQIRDLSRATEHLKVLEILCTRIAEHGHTGLPVEEAVSFSQLVSLFLTSAKLKSVGLRFWNNANIWNLEGLNATPLLALLPWANLREIYFHSLSINNKELKDHLRKMQSGSSIKLEGVHLLSGLWADVLDVLREKANSTSIVNHVTGQEDQNLDAKEFNSAVSYRSDKRPNRASRYIRGKLAENPLRPPPVQDSAEEDDAD